MQRCTIPSSRREEMLDITPLIREAVREHGWGNGVLLVFCPHTTCGLTINEGADPDVVRDMTSFFAERIPLHNAWRHAEGNSDAHIKSSVLGSSVFVIVDAKELCLGTWQKIYLYEGDGPRTRSVWLQWLPGGA